MIGWDESTKGGDRTTIVARHRKGVKLIASFPAGTHLTFISDKQCVAINPNSEPVVVDLFPPYAHRLLQPVEQAVTAVAYGFSEKEKLTRKKK